MSALSSTEKGFVAEVRERLQEYFGGREPEKLFRRMVALSVALHAVGFGIFLGRGMSPERSRFDWRSQAVEISLLNVPPPRAVKKEAPKPVTEAPPVTAPTQEPVTKSEPVSAPAVAKAAPQAAPSATASDALFLKRKAEAEELARARKAEAEREAAAEAARQSERERLRRTLAALKQQGVPEAAPSPESSGQSAEEISADLAQAGRTQALAAAQSAALSREARYEASVRSEVEKFWKVPAGLALRSDLVTTVQFTIDKDGTVREVKIAKRSASSAFDDSVERAARQIQKFETPPLGFPSTFSINFRNVQR